MLFSVFLALAVFGGAVTLIDFISGFGHSPDSGDSGHGDGSADGHGTDVAVVHHSHFDGTVRPRERDSGAALYGAVAWLRRSVYFSLGAGATGLTALVTGSGDLGALLWATLAGGGSLGILSLVKHFQVQDLDSTVSEEELLYETGEVVVTILPGAMGKIRMKGKGSMIERYARAQDPQASFAVGQQVKVSEVREDILLVVSPDQEVQT